MGSVFITLLRSMIKELAGPLGIFMYCDGQKEKHPDTDNKWFLNFNQRHMIALIWSLSGSPVALYYSVILNYT